MVLLDDWGVLIDTPGFREFGLAIHNSDLLLEPMKISDFAKECRLSNCSHTVEAGCAVLEAVNKGLLDKEVYNSYLKLRREISHYSASEHEKRKKDKNLSKMVDEAKSMEQNSKFQFDGTLYKRNCRRYTASNQC